MSLNERQLSYLWHDAGRYFGKVYGSTDHIIVFARLVENAAILKAVGELKPKWGFKYAKAHLRGVARATKNEIHNAKPH